MEKNNPEDEELRRFRKKAAEVLSVEETMNDELKADS